MIDWGKRKLWQGKVYAWVTCPLCGDGRFVWVGVAPHLQGGYCGACCLADISEPKATSWNRGKAHGRWGGGRHKHTEGYVYIHVEALLPKDQQAYGGMADKRGYILEHRLVAARKLGRVLTEQEVAHHVNGIKDDNRAENIEVFVSASDHRCHHVEASWAQSG